MNADDEHADVIASRTDSATHRGALVSRGELTMIAVGSALFAIHLVAASNPWNLRVVDERVAPATIVSAGVAVAIVCARVGLRILSKPALAVTSRVGPDRTGSSDGGQSAEGLSGRGRSIEGLLRSVVLPYVLLLVAVSVIPTVGFPHLVELFAPRGALTGIDGVIEVPGSDLVLEIEAGSCWFGGRGRVFVASERGIASRRVEISDTAPCDEIEVLEAGDRIVVRMGCSITRFEVREADLSFERTDQVSLPRGECVDGRSLRPGPNTFQPV